MGLLQGGGVARGGVEDKEKAGVGSPHSCWKEVVRGGRKRVFLTVAGENIVVYRTDGCVMACVVCDDALCDAITWAVNGLHVSLEICHWTPPS